MKTATRERLQLAGGFLLGLLLGGFLLFRPALLSLLEAKAKTVDQQASLHQGETRLAALPTLNSHIADIETQLAEHPIRLPASDDMTSILEWLSQAARQSGIRIQQVTPAPPALGDHHGHWPLKLTLKGNWASTRQFLHRLATPSAPWSIEAAELYSEEAQERSAALSLTLSLKSYFTPDAVGLPDTPSIATDQAVLDDTDAAIPASFTDNPFALPTQPPMHSAPAESLTYVGRIRANQLEWALMLNANGQLERYQTGDMLPDGRRLTRQTETAIYLQDRAGQQQRIPLQATRPKGG